MKRMLSMLALLGTFFLLPLMAQAQKYTITINQVEHATITASYGYGASATVVNSGDQVDRYTRLNIQVTADAGYVATHYTINGTEKPITSTYGDSEWVQGDMTISAKVVAVTPCTINITQPTEGGTLTVNSTKPRKVLNSGDKVDSGTTIRLSAKPAEGYDIDYWLIDGQKVKPFDDASIRYGISHLVMKDVTVSVAFKNLSAQTLVSVTVVKPEHGTIELHKGTGIFDEVLNSGDQVETGSQITMLIKPDEGYKLDHWLINDKEEPKDDFRPARKTITISEATTISAVLVESGYVVTYEQPANGTITVKTVNPVADVPSGTRVKEEAPISIQATVNEGYEFKHYLINGEKRLPNDMQTLLTYYVAPKEVSAVTIEAVIEKNESEPKSYVVTIEEPENAYMKVTYGDYSSPTQVNNGNEVPEGTELRVDLFLDEGYELEHFLVNGQPTPSESEEFPGIKVVVTGPLTLSAVVEKNESEPKPCIITIEEPEHAEMTVQYGSSLFPTTVKSGNEVPEGTELSVELYPDDGYEFVHFLVNGEQTPSESPDYAKMKVTVTGSLTLSAVVQKEGAVNPTEGTITVKSEGTGGHITASYKNPDSGNPMSIIPNMPKKLPNGTEVTLTAAITTEGFEVTYTNNGDPVPAEALSADGTVYTFTVNGDATVVATFAQKQVTGEFTVTCIADPEEGGEVSASTAEGPITNETKVAGGEIVTVTATPKENFEVDQWFLNDEELKDIKGQGSYTFALTKDVTIKVTFKSTLPPAEYAVTVEPVLPSAEAGDVKLFQKNGTPFESGKSVVEGTEMYVEVMPADKYELEMLQVGETKLPAGDEKLVNIAGGGVKYTFTVTAATKVQATFKLVNAIEQLAQSGVAVFLTNGGTRLEVAGAAEGAEVRLYDYTGQLLLASTEHALDISALPAGSYIVLVGNYTTRIVK